MNRFSGSTPTRIDAICVFIQNVSVISVAGNQVLELTRISMRQFEIDSDFEIIKYLMLIGGSRLLNGQAEGSETGSLQTSFYDIQGGGFF